jgi:hypothetical protein
MGGGVFEASGRLVSEAHPDAMAKSSHAIAVFAGVGKASWVPRFRGTRRTPETLRCHRESMPALARTACFRGDFARARVVWAIRESMAPSENKKDLWCNEGNALGRHINPKRKRGRLLL